MTNLKIQITDTINNKSISSDPIYLKSKHSIDDIITAIKSSTLGKGLRCHISILLQSDLFTTMTDFHSSSAIITAEFQWEDSKSKIKVTMIEKKRR